MSQGVDPLVPFPGRACVKLERFEPLPGFVALDRIASKPGFFFVGKYLMID